ncbi:hypothetical protein JB92DRAFT_780876 [Gautieria morchelliformis]|nr:hypothetical protein JB92DRAFT_780876 [Gautieria morchelliformis]
MIPSDGANNIMYPNTSSNSASRGNLDALDPSLNGAHPQQYRTTTAFNPAFSANPIPFSPTSAPSHAGFNAPGPSPNPSSQQQHQLQQPLTHQRPYRSELPTPAPFPSHFSGSQNNYPTKADVFGTSQSLDTLGRYEYDGYGDPAANSVPQHAHIQPHLPVKQQNYGGAFGMPTQSASTGSALLQSQQVQVSKLSQQGHSQAQAPQQQSQPQQGFVSNGGTVINGTGAYLNGQGQGQGPPPHHSGMQSTVNGIGYATPAHGHSTGQHPMHHAPGPGPGPGPGQPQNVGIQHGPPQGQHPQPQSVRGESSQEEISTIFVVGFPEDMHEREFQNMFTFSVGFEAATLKIPNKDSSAYGPAAGASGAASTLRQAGFIPPSSSYPNNAHSQGGNAPYTGAQDPYNLVTVNSGGVVVDGPQGTSSSWQQSGSSDQFSGDASHSQAPAMPPRKQIIGFAKFRSRQEALDARDVLQGRRVDIEKGAVLKAEMAKKNLHTKRGVGPLGLPLALMGGGGVVGPDMLAGVPGFMGASAPAPAPTSAQVQPGDPLTARDRQLGVLGAMGLGGIARRQDTREDEKERRDITQQQQERPREDDDRRRKEQEMERERNNKLRMTNATLYDAFHSVPMGQQHAGSSVNGTGSSSQSTLTPGPGYADPSSTFPGYGLQANGGGNGFQVNTNGTTGNGNFGQSHFQNTFSPSGPDTFGQSSASGGNGGGSSTWGLPSKPADASQKTPALPSNLPPRPPSSLQSSPPPNFDAPYLPSGGSARPLYSGSDSSTFSPSEYSAALPPIGPRPRVHSPVFEGQPYGGASNAQRGGSSLPPSSSSSVAGSQSSLEGSGGSSNNARQGNASDQNPPINTLYVGNLPNSPAPTGYPPNYLEESLRALFSRCPGYRKLCFRQKSNGPMCFVEFEDVSYATKALSELYGHQLHGFVKGGIRLSFSKNPLGVRPTASNTNSHQGGRRDGGREWNGPSQLQLQQQQQQQQPSQPSMNYSSIHDAFPSRPTQSQQQGLSLDMGSGRQMRHEPSEMGSPNPVYNYSVSPPPSRFFSPPPSSSQSSFGSMGPLSSSAFPRASAQGSFNHHSAGFGSSQHSPPYGTDGGERIRFQDPPPHGFIPSPGIETATRVG